MRKKQFQKPLLVLVLWGVILAAVFAVTLLGNLALARRVGYARAHDPNPYLNAAESYLNHASFREAWAEIARAREKAPDHPRVHKVTGDFHFRQQHWKEALEAYRTAIDAGTDARGVYINALWSLIELRYYRDAIDFGETCIALGFADAVFPRYIAEAHLRRGDPNAAIPYLERAMEGYANDLHLMKQLAEAYRVTGRRTRAHELQKRIDALEAPAERASAGG